MSITFMPQQFWGGFTGLEPGLMGLAQGLGKRNNPGYKESRERMKWINTPISEGGLGGWQNAFNNTRQQQWMEQFFKSLFGTPSSPVYAPPSARNLAAGGTNTPYTPLPYTNVPYVNPMVPTASPANAQDIWNLLMPYNPPANLQIPSPPPANLLPQYQEGGTIKVDEPIKVLQDLMGLEKNAVPVVAHKGETILNKEATKLLGDKNVDTLNKIGQLMPKAEQGARIAIGDILNTPTYKKSKEQLGEFKDYSNARMADTFKYLFGKIKEAFARAKEKGTSVANEISPELKKLYADALKSYQNLHQGQHLTRESDIMNQVLAGKNLTGTFSNPTNGRNIIPDMTEPDVNTNYNYPDALTRYLLTRGTITEPAPVKKTPKKEEKKKSITPVPPTPVPPPPTPTPTPEPTPTPQEYTYPTPSGTPTNWQNGLPANYNDMTQALWNLASQYPSERGPMFALSGQYIGQPQQDQRMQVFGQLMNNYGQAKQIPQIEASTELTKQSAIAKGIANNWDKIAEPMKLKQMQIQTKQLEAMDPHIKELMDLEVKGKKLGVQKAGMEIIAAQYKAYESLMRAYALANSPTTDINMYQKSVQDYVKNLDGELNQIKNLATKAGWNTQTKRAYYRILLQKMIIADPNLINKSDEELRQAIGAETYNIWGKVKGEGRQTITKDDIESLKTELMTSPAFMMSKRIGDSLTQKTPANTNQTAMLMQMLNKLGILQ